ncbi:dTDP-fucopyranose mutase [Diatrype stigma]|uniref:dTDP-fucopyranose mutase n=1 Tax=Diatrype stigma TaxID=117547 RepID=A0AAN9UFJ1_9PEZI
MADKWVELSDEQIEQLLSEAETRLSAQANDGKSLSKSSKPSALQVGASASKPNTAVALKATQPAASESKSKEALSVRIPEARKGSKEKTAKADAGPSWYNLPKTDLTPELKRDLQILKMRDILDPKRFYRKDSSKAAVPEYSQVGTLVEGPTEWHSARMTKRERKRTLLDEVLENEDATKRFKSKYGQIQEAKTSGKKGHYKKMMEKRYGRKG